QHVSGPLLRHQSRRLRRDGAATPGGRRPRVRVLGHDPNTSLSAQFAGFTGANPVSGDGANVVGFTNRPDLDRVLGSTSFTVDTVTGEILESDIFLNSTFAWSVSAAGEAGRQDVESIALHEIGHLHGLGHSMLGETELFGGGRRVLGAEAVMFPIAFAPGTINRTLRADDIAGISDIY